MQPVMRHAFFDGPVYVAGHRSTARAVWPQPGDGLSPEAQRTGLYDFILFGRTADGRRVDARVIGDRHPGYGSTSKMPGEAGAYLAFDLPKAEHPGGFWTPATLMGEMLRRRLVVVRGDALNPCAQIRPQ